MLRDLDLNLLKVFIAVYENRSITLTADELDMTQPGVSGLIKRLQQQLGVQLFVRSGRGIVPTHQAHELIRQVSPAFTQIQNAIESIDTFSTEQPRKFIVYSSEPTMLMLLPLIEKDESLGNVSIELHPTLADEESLIQSLNQQQADLAIEFSNYSTPSFFSEYLFEDQICLIARKGHPRVNGAISGEQFYQEKHITLKLRREDAYLADYYTKERMNERIVAAECESLLSQLSMVSSSDCISATAISIAKMYKDKFDIQIIEPPFTTIPIRYQLMTHNRMKHSPANMWLRDKLRSYFDQN
ncbi:LysR family transcriptional regulator [Vibrio hannami]|uniref:LysR family transcriptional regulator n=1 Tax=Vibrio hannami TaxID=2717094 RepID=UPI00240EADEA|nr:LysR family transcriptional regulator [Vibrio hannami]MDG3084900.1 LysR family transcriptional regulator [Vibrio hannami]